MTTIRLHSKRKITMIAGVLAIAASAIAQGDSSITQTVPGALESIELSQGPLVPGERNESQVLGVADIKGNGPYDLFLAYDELYPYAQHNSSGAPEYGPAIKLHPPMLNGAIDEENLLLAAPLAEADAYFARIAIAAGHVKTMEPDNYITFEVEFNDGSSVVLGSFRGDAELATGCLALDTNGDGVGDELPLDVAFRSYTFPIPEGEWPVTLRILVDVDGGEEVGIDGIEILEACGSEVISIARSGFENDDSELTFTTNLSAGSVSSNTVDFRGALLAGDGFNDFVAVAPAYVDTLFSQANLDLGFNSWEGDGFLMVEDTGQDGLPGEVALTFEPVAEPPSLQTVSGTRIEYAPSLLGTSHVASGGGLVLDPADGVQGLNVIPAAAMSMSACTWSAWINVDSYETGAFTTTHPHTILSGYSSGSLAAVFRLFEGKVQAGWYDGERYLLSTIEQPIATGEWVHVAVTIDGSSAPRLFVNGLEQPATISSGDPTAPIPALDDLRIGYHSDTGSLRILDGSIRDFRMYDRDMSEAELTAMAAAGANTYNIIPAEELNAGDLVTMPDDRLIAASFAGNSLVLMQYDREGSQFQEIARQAIPGVGTLHSLAASVDGSDGIALHMSTRGPADYLSYGHPLYSEDFMPYDGAGIWLGGKPYDLFYQAGVTFFGDSTIFSDVSETGQDVPQVPYGIAGLAPYADGLVAGSELGMLYSYTTDETGEITGRRYLWHEGQELLLHPYGDARPIAIANESQDGYDLLVQSPAGLHLYRPISLEDMIFQAIQPIQAEAVSLYFGRDAVITSGDINGDTIPDLIAGNASGELLWAQGITSTEYSAPTPLSIDGEAYNYDAGYRGSLQGPAQGRLGYTAPTVFDWDGDGRNDLLLSNISGDYFLVRHRDTDSAEFDAPVPIYLDGLELRTTWRNQPAIAALGTEAKPALVTFDADDKLHLYWHYDAQNVMDGGLLLAEGGEAIDANELDSSGTGRVRLQLYDWDGDGALDLLLGACPETSIPSPESGLPRHSDYNHAAILLMRNVASNEAPAFADPLILADENGPIDLGDETCSPVAVPGASGTQLLFANSLGEVQRVADDNLLKLSGFITY
ncbi:LamG domain-containing protein [bacterium]|nr:LamG domain-containing protein [bacterium]